MNPYKLLANIHSLKENSLSIHYFGLGFIQLKYDKYHRFHFYTDQIEPIIPEDEIHNHRYDFTSEILWGSLRQEIYHPTSGTRYEMTNESCQAGVEADTTAVICDVELLISEDYSKGSKYTLPHSTYHKVYSTDCITFLRRSDYKKEYAQVLRPRFSDKVCPFSKQLDENELWSIVTTMAAKI